MRLGVFTRVFKRSTTGSVFDAIREVGIKELHFSLPDSDIITLADTIEKIGAHKISTLCKDRGLKVASISGTFNVIHPDMKSRQNATEGCIRLIKNAPELGSPLVSLSTGTRNPQNMWSWHTENGTSEAWNDLLKTLQILLATAEDYGVSLGIEPEPGNVINSPAKARKLLDEIASPALKIIIDGANLIGNQPLDTMAEIFENALELLAPETVMAHAKEIPIDPNKTMAVPGEGNLDWKLYLGTLIRYGFKGPLIMHSLPENGVAQARAYLAGIMKKLYEL